MYRIILQVVPGVGELNKYEERQELRKWTFLKMCFCWLRAQIQLYSAEFFFLISSEWYKSNWHFNVKKYQEKKEKRGEHQLFHYVNVKFLNIYWGLFDFYAIEFERYSFKAEFQYIF